MCEEEKNKRKMLQHVIRLPSDIYDADIADIIGQLPNGHEKKLLPCIPKTTSTLPRLFFLAPISQHTLLKYTMNRPLGSMGGQQNSGMSPQEQQTIKMMQGAMESCVVKTAMSGVAGRRHRQACTAVY